jgi:hypothetical protein
MDQQSGEGLIEPVIAIAMLAVVVAIALSECDEQKRWTEYAVEQNCVVTATERGTWHHVPDGKGGATMHRSPDRKTYRCEDGTTHTR